MEWSLPQSPRWYTTCRGPMSREIDRQIGLLLGWQEQPSEERPWMWRSPAGRIGPLPRYSSDPRMTAELLTSLTASGLDISLRMEGSDLEMIVINAPDGIVVRELGDTLYLVVARMVHRLLAIKLNMEGAAKA